METYRVVGCLSDRIMGLLGLPLDTNREIYLSDRTLQHIADRHSEIGRLYMIAEIIEKPTAVSFREKDSSISFFKELDGFEVCLDLAVRPSSLGEYFVRTLHYIEVERVKKRIERGIAILVD